jgi:hypothetical protein
MVMSGLGVEMWKGSAASVLVVGAMDCENVDGGNEGIDPAKAAAAAAASPGSKLGRVERGV